ncbi:MAG TPA: chorismate mutase [Firmicutes bacterium]|nr:chorismate mutase [Bacillota bacterium]
MDYRVRGVRGAITVASNTAAEILAGTRQLIEKMVAANDVEAEDIASIFFSVTPDLNAAFPAAAARSLGWKYVPLLDLNEANISGDLSRCIRILMHINTRKTQAEIRHIYLGGAAVLRPDLAE